MSGCEAMVLIKSASKPQGMYHACGKEPADLHHKLTRSRGGLILDEASEDYHQMYLCRDHHNLAHDEGRGYMNGFLIRGYVITHTDGRPLYVGPDPYLSKIYGAR